MYKLNYAKVNLQGAITVIKRKHPIEIIGDVEKILERNCLSVSNKSLVYLITLEKVENENAAIFIDENKAAIMAYLRSVIKSHDAKHIYLQEYRSYEEAYKVALSMKELSPLCYEPDSKLN